MDDLTAVDDSGGRRGWRTVRRLGAGGMGEVLLVERDGQHGALKRIHPWFAGDDEFRKRFAREAEVCSRVSGPNIAELVDFDTHSDDPWYVTEYVDGPTLGTWVSEHGPASGEQLDLLARGLLDGLQQLADAGVIHRDLKPSNVLVADRMRPVLVDFGVAAATEATAMTSTGARIGSPGWMPPEQLSGTADWDSRADIYGWATLVTFAASGAPPFGRGRPEAVSHRVLTMEPDLSAVPDRFRPAVSAALSKQPGSRPHLPVLSAALSGDADALATLTAGTRDDSGATQVGRETGAVGVTAAMAAQTVPKHAAGVGDSVDDGSRRRRRMLAPLAGAGFALATAGGAIWFFAGDGDTNREDIQAATTSSTRPTTTTTSAPPTTTTSTTTTTVPLLAAHDWLNSTLEVECGLSEPLVVHLHDGHWASGTEPGSTDVTVTDVVFMDVDADGSDETVVEATCTGGSHGFFEQALLFDEVAGSVARIGRPVVAQQVTREDLTYVTREPGYDDNSPPCCPTHYKFIRYAYDADEPGYVLTESWRGEYTGTGQSASHEPVPGEPCTPGSHEDCVDQGGGRYTYVAGYSQCMEENPDFPEFCADPDGDGYPGYPDSQ